MCTTDIFKEAREKGIHLVTRVPNSSEVFKKFTSQYNESELEPIFDDEDCHLFGKFCGTDIVAGEKVKLLLVSNNKMRK